MARSIYVGTVIITDIDVLWSRTQDPDQHERWDLRFSSITYLPKHDEDDPQRFEYATRLGFGLRVAGWGESIATREQDSSRTSSLKFGSAQPISLIEEGSGYWKYTPSESAVLFETGYDYKTRWGLLGRMFDAFVFRPMIGWATAWSFDRLRLWLEEEIDPGLSALRSIVHSVCRIVLSIVLLWHGLVPKLIMRHPKELALIEGAGFSVDVAGSLLLLAGLAEVLFACVLIVCWRVRWLYIVTAAALIALLAPALEADPGLVAAPFGPITLTLAMLGLCAAGWSVCVHLPSARRCARTKQAMSMKAGEA